MKICQADYEREHAQNFLTSHLEKPIWKMAAILQDDYSDNVIRVSGFSITPTFQVSWKSIE